jgi:tetratricopeptide (TPR) repeat protein
VHAAKLRFESAMRFRSALGLASRGANEDAIAQYRDLVALVPDFSDAWINLSELERQAWRLDAAFDAAKNAAKSAGRTSARAAASFQIANIHDVRDELSEARAAYEETLRLDPTYRGANDALGVLLVRLGDRARAAASFAREIELHPEHAAPAWNHLGILHLEAQRLSIAASHFERAIELDARLADAHNNLGTAARLAGDLVRAEAAYRRAEGLDPKFIQAIHGCGLVRLAAGDPAGAEEAFRRALAMDPSFAPARQRLAALGAREVEPATRP